MTRTDAEKWFAAYTAAWWLSVEAGAVMWLRGFRIMAGGGLGQREVVRMMAEKWLAGGDLAMKLALSPAATPHALAARSIRHYQGRVSANRRRLSRSAAAR